MSRGKKFAEKSVETRFLSSRNRHLQQHFEHHSIWTLQAWTAIAWRRVMQHGQHIELATNMLHWSSLLSLYASLQEEWTTSVTCHNFPARFVPSQFTTPLDSQVVCRTAQYGTSLPQTKGMVVATSITLLATQFCKKREILHEVREENLLCTKAGCGNSCK